MMSGVLETTGRDRARAFGSAALLVAVLTADGAAQDTDPRATASRRFGPLYVTPTLTLQDFGVDTNVFNQPHEVESDFTFTLTPGIQATAGSRRALVTLRSNTDFVYFARHQTERSINQDLAGEARIALGRVTLFADAAYRNTRRRPIELDVDARSRRRERAGEAGVRVQLSTKLTAGVSRWMADSEYDADAVFDDTLLARTLNRRVRGVVASLRHAVTPLTAVSVAAEVSQWDFPASPVRNSDSRRASLGVEFGTRAVISGTAEIGYQRFLPQHPLPGFSGVVGSVRLERRLVESTVVQLSLNRHVSYSYAEEEPYYVVAGYGAGIRRYLTRRFDLELAAGFAKHRYRRVTADPANGTTPGRVEPLRNASIAAGYAASDQSRLTVALIFWSRRSDQRDYRNFDGVRLGVTVAHRF